MTKTHAPNPVEMESTLKDAEALVCHYSEWCDADFVANMVRVQNEVIKAVQDRLDEINKKASQAEVNKALAEQRCRQLRNEILTAKNSAAIEKLKRLAEIMKELDG